MKVSEKKYDAYKLDKLRASKRAFIMRKRRGIQVDLEMARELVGSRLELYFKKKKDGDLGRLLKCVFSGPMVVLSYRYCIQFVTTVLRKSCAMGKFNRATFRHS